MTDNKNSSKDKVSLEELVRVLSDAKVRAEVESLARSRGDQRKKVSEWGAELLHRDGVSAIDLRRYISEVIEREVPASTMRSVFGVKRSTKSALRRESGKK